MRYNKINTEYPEVKIDVNMKKPADVNAPYPESAPSYWEWKIPREQIKIVNRLNDIKKPGNRKI